jgi:hypothetical protein
MDERRLYDLKWFDYRPLAPDTATMAFSLWHVRKLAAHLSDLDEGGFIYACNSAFKGINVERLRQWKHFGVMEKLRWWADKRFLRYEDFWELAFGVHLDFGLGTRGYGKGRKSRTIFVQVFTSPKILAEVNCRASLRQQERLILSDHPYFQAPAWRGKPLQVDYAAHVAGELKRRYGGSAQERAKALVESGRLSASALSGIFMPANIS